MLLANIARFIKPNGQLLLVGENKEGIKSAAKLLEPFGERVNKLDSARHCSLFCTEVSTQVPDFNIEDWLETVGHQPARTVFYTLFAAWGVQSR